MSHKFSKKFQMFRIFSDRGRSMSALLFLHLNFNAHVFYNEEKIVLRHIWTNHKLEKL